MFIIIISSGASWPRAPTTTKRNNNNHHCKQKEKKILAKLARSQLPAVYRVSLFGLTVSLCAKLNLTLSLTFEL